MEVFPALALATIAPKSFARLGALKYNPANKKFSLIDWRYVTKCAARQAQEFGFEPLAVWLYEANEIQTPKKADQDRLDSAICILIALQWKFGPAERSMFLGDLENGYIVTPASQAVRAHLTPRARKNGVRIDGRIF